MTISLLKIYLYKFISKIYDIEIISIFFIYFSLIKFVILYNSLRLTQVTQIRMAEEKKWNMTDFEIIGKLG